MAKTQTKEVAVIEKLEELKDYATQAQNPYLLGRINRIIQEVKTDEISQENYHEEDVHEVATAKTHEFANYKEEVKYIEQVEDKSDVTWEEIHDTFVENTEIDDSINFFYWLKENYNVPTKKQ